jgi:hypothetical protein
VSARVFFFSGGLFYRIFAVYFWFNLFSFSFFLVFFFFFYYLCFSSSECWCVHFYFCLFDFIYWFEPSYCLASHPPDALDGKNIGTLFDWRWRRFAAWPRSHPNITNDSFWLSSVHKWHRHEVPVESKIIEIVYQDDDMIVIDKPCSVPVRKNVKSRM